MKATDLMIGDWVEHIVVGEQNRNHPMKVNLQDLYRIQSAISNSDDGLIVRPIPLTSEILEKNGFHHEKSGDWVCDEDYPNAIVYTFDCKLRIIQSYTMLTDIDIEYIHELQHALRLCQIDKEITL